jgi:peptidoglycan/LPS O-acetylase OafA/YrhL
MSQSLPRHLPQLDGLRAIAVLAVLYTHFVPQRYWLFSTYWGEQGVRMFFVLSGFLITEILFRLSEAGGDQGTERWRRLGTFYARRILRLTPAFYATLLLMAAFDVPNTRQTFWWHVAYLSNVEFAITDSWQEAVGHFWTLAVEFQFYLVWPLLVLFVPRKVLAAISLGILPAAVVYRYWGSRAGIADITIWVLPPWSLDALVLGSLTAWLSHERHLGSDNAWLRIIGSCGLGIWLVGEYALASWPVSQWIGPTAISLFFAWIVLRAAETRGGRFWHFLQSPWLTHIGRISYGIYLLHMLVWALFFYRLKSVLSWMGPVADIPVAVALILITIGAAEVSWHWLERPVNRYRQNL